MIINGNSLNILKQLPDCCIHTVVTDPPYGLGKPPEVIDVLKCWLQDEEYHQGTGFMNMAWDSFTPGPAIWREALRVMRPGGHLAAFSSPRTYDLLILSLRLAGFEIRDQLMWLYGEGFPKSKNLAVCIDKAQGFLQHRGQGISYAGERALNYQTCPGRNGAFGQYQAEGTPGEQWNGWGTGLKPAYEPICLARKPIDGTLAQNVERWGTGGLNIDACRSGERWPANVALDSGVEKTLGDRARFFYCPKAKKSEREAGLESFPTLSGGELTGRQDGSAGLESPRSGPGRGGSRRNRHPTVKPVELLRWLVRLISPPGGILLDPFLGSGSTGIACVGEGVTWIGIEINPEYCEIARARVHHAKHQ